MVLVVLALLVRAQELGLVPLKPPAGEVWEVALSTEGFAVLSSKSEQHWSCNAIKCLYMSIER